MEARKVGAFIQSCRKELGLTQGELGNKLNVTDKAISRWERGVGFPDIHMIEPLAAVLGVSVQELMNGERSTPEKTEVDVAVPDSSWRPGKPGTIIATVFLIGYIVIRSLCEDPAFISQLGWLSYLDKALLLLTAGTVLAVSRKEAENGEN